VVNFTVARTLSRVLSQGSTVVGYSLSPELSANYARKNWEFYLRWVAILIVSAIVGAVVTCALLPTVGPRVIRLWTHGSVTMGSGILFAISVSLQGFWMVCYTQLAAANKHHRQCILYFATTLGALGASALTVGRFGLIAVPAVMVLADAVVLVGSVALAYRAFPEIPFGKIGRLWTLGRSSGDTPATDASPVHPVQPRHLPLSRAK
jgi:O-antigen/teichoic acid export membrane protein